MKILVIYDNEGVIIAQSSGNVRQPIGIPFMITDVPEGKLVERIDTTVEPHEPIFIEVQKSQLEQEIESLKSLVADLTEVVLMGV